MIHAFDERFRRLKWAMFSIDFEVFCLGVHVLPARLNITIDVASPLNGGPREINEI